MAVESAQVFAMYQSVGARKALLVEMVAMVTHILICTQTVALVVAQVAT